MEPTREAWTFIKSGGLGGQIDEDGLADVLGGVHVAIQHPESRAVDEVNRSVSKAESIRKFVIIETELTEESGHLTPSLKIKRNQVMSDFSPVVDEIYGSGPSTVEAAVNG